MSLSQPARPLARIGVIFMALLLAAGCQSITPLAAPSPQSSATPMRPTAVAQASPSSTSKPSGEPSATAATTTASPPPVASITDTPLPDAPLATIDTLNAIELKPNDAVELAYEYGRTDERRRVARTTPLDVAVGDRATFNVLDVGAAAGTPDRNYTIDATLVLVLEHVLVYVEDGIDVDLAALEQSSQEFNDEIYPRTRELFGSEWSPGIDGDPRLTILNATIRGAAGYFSSADEMPTTVNRFSNEREMFYINVLNVPPGTPEYGSTLAHEFQHMIEWNETPRAATWSNEGLSQLAEDLNGFEERINDGPFAYLANPDLQLTDWGDTPQESIANYGASYLFMSYFYEQYGANLDLRQFLRDGAGADLDNFVEVARAQNPAIEDFGDLVGDWSLANLVNDTRFGDGRYSYEALRTSASFESLDGQRDDSVAQFGADFLEIPISSNERVLRFDGSDTIGVVAAKPEGKAMWWSNRGDDIESSMERGFDLRGVSSATLQFRLWFDIEESFDYGYVSVSTDGAATFTTLPGRYTTTDDPQNANLGHGYTGMSGSVGGADDDGTGEAAWRDEQMDLTPYAGQQIVLRFSVVNDQGVNRAGMAVDTIRIPEIGFSDDAEAGAAGWQSTGFVRTDNQIDQQWEVRLIRVSGNAVMFEPLALDEQKIGEFQLAPNERGALAIIASTPHTTERATYRVTTLQP